MKPFFAALLFFILTKAGVSYSQQYINKEKFFADTSIINATLSFNMGKMLKKKDKEGLLFPATFSCNMGDTLAINDHISVEVRGHFRRAYCYIPPLKLIYKNNTASPFYHLKSLKLVSNCKPTYEYDQYLLKEYLCYKIYNLITDKSLRVRLLNLSYKDSSGKKATITKHAFLLEDIKDLAKRNACVDLTDRKFSTERTDRRQMTIVAIFEYMIGNTDWAVPVNHNIILIRNKKDSLSRPFAVAYDFDYSGLVNTEYAVPDERLGISNVTQRVYRGFPRTMEELNDVLGIFKEQKANIYATINNFNLLTSQSKNEMISFLDDFYSTINKQDEIKTAFITNARTQ
jgi:hypothetical protein